MEKRQSVQSRHKPISLSVLTAVATDGGCWKFRLASQGTRGRTGGKTLKISVYIYLDRDQSVTRSRGQA